MSSQSRPNSSFKEKMKKEMIDFFVCPTCETERDLSLTSNEENNGEIKEGKLKCNSCGTEFLIKNYIPRFVPSDNYAQSFGYQWNKHIKTQIDKFSGISMSRNRFFKVTEWDENLKGQKILEAGCGAGRFTQIALDSGAEVFSFDYSNAIDANLANNGLQESFHPFQTDIYHIPMKKNSFDKVFCFGVLQHCPDPKKAFMSLIPCLKQGGSIAIDIYDLTLRAFVNPKYWLRPITRHLSPDQLYKIVQKMAPKLFPVKMWITEHIPFGKYFAFFIPVAYHKGFIKEVEGLSYEQLLEMSVLDTFDKFAPKYDKPQGISTIRKWFSEAGLTNIEVCYGPNGINGRGVKP